MAGHVKERIAAGKKPGERAAEQRRERRMNMDQARTAILASRELQRASTLPPLPPRMVQSERPYRLPSLADVEVMAQHLYTYGAIAAHCGVSLDLFDDWRRGASEFSQAVARGRALARGEVVSCAFVTARMGDPSMQRFILASGEDSEFIERTRVETTGLNGGPIETRDLSLDDPQEFARVLGALSPAAIAETLAELPAESRAKVAAALTGNGHSH